MFVRPAALAVLAIWVGLRIFGGYPCVPAGIRQLHRREYAMLAAAADTVLPRGGAIEPSGTDAAIPQYVDRYLAHVPGGKRLLMRLLFFLLEHGTLFFPAGGLSSLRRFSGLPHDSRVTYLQGWQRSQLYARTLVFTSLRSILGLAYLACPEVQRALRLAPKRVRSPICEADLLWPPVGKRSEQIRYTRADLTPPSDGTPLDSDGPLHPAYEEGRG
jgi:hypothetical protein